MYGNTFSFFWIIAWTYFWYFISKSNKLFIWKTFKHINAELNQHEQNINLDSFQMYLLEGMVMNNLYFKNGKAKKKYCVCLSREKIAELKRLYGYEIIQCAGNCCPYYSIGCGRENIQKHNKKDSTF